MNKEYRILNEKLNIIFEEMMQLKEAYRKEKTLKEIKELECKLDDIKNEIERRKEDDRFESDMVHSRMQYFRGTEQVYSEPKETMEQIER